MSFHPFKKIRVAPNAPVDDKQINAVQDNIASAIGQLLGKDQLDSALLKNVILYPGVINKVSHTLGRELQGWYVVRNHGSYAVLTDMQDTNQSPHLLLFLTTPAQVTVDLLVF